MLKASTLGLIGVLLVAAACENGIDSKPYDENLHETSTVASQPSDSPDASCCGMAV